ncbi:MAG: DEAD/DEAH box helicase family protein [Akkermansiaceae bacterium]|nr:DEAD/DEAH box helicase family protein [Akkermansiaceae bacterium]
MLLDERCWFLAVDFDGEGWQGEVRAFMEVCRGMEVPASLERSRSGDGGHVWLFFEEPVPAAMARSLGSHLLTLATQRCPQTKLQSYDRFFPNQDTLPRGGFGNLIALPLQKEPRKHGNSEFVDVSLTPYPDQWAYLASVRRITLRQVEKWVEKARKSDQVLGVRMVPDEADDTPWKAQPSRRSQADLRLGKAEKPRSLEMVLGDQIYVPKENLPPALHNALVRLAAFQNPEFYKAQAMRLPTYDKPRVIACAEDYPEHVALPRGCLEEMMEMLDGLKIPTKIDDQRNQGEVLQVTFQGDLRPDQLTAATALEQHDTGILAATTAFGKTVLAAAMIARRGVNTLILVHRKQLMDQWVERLVQFLDVEEKQIGRLGGGRRKLTGNLDIAIIQSLVRKGEVKDLVADYGHLVVDECHHLSAHSFELVARRAKARYVLGLSATVTRKDGHHPILFMQCGPVRYRVDARTQANKRPFRHEVIVRPTGFRLPLETDDDPRLAFQQICDALYQDHRRNRLIADEILDAVRAGRTPLVLTERTEHIDFLNRLLEDELPHIVVLKGGMPAKELKAAITSLGSIPESEPRVILATGRFVGEGFDDSRLDTLFLTMPVSWKGTIAQYAGRLHRLHGGKKVVRVFDYADLDVPMLSRMFDRRCAGYEEVGYTILLPAHALPGWPPEVPLPIDPQWKNDYAASVRRLIRDGVDAPLARLFVHVTRPPEKGAKGTARARSASEKFLHRRLQTLPDTKGQFKLNARLPIPFNERSEMEVDFLCREKNLVIELDGDQHLSDKETYRRDRRKDALLQQNGYLVLRFLTTDLGENLDHVMDTIQRVLVGR